MKLSLCISVLLLFKHYISHKITFGAPSSGRVLCSACGAFICEQHRGRPACAFAQSDQCLCYSIFGKYHM